MKKSMKTWWDHNWDLVMAFMLPFLIMGAVYANFKVYPFGSNSVLVLDLNGQYVSYFEAFRDAFLEGKSLLYSHSRSLSGEMLGIVAYYLASPFSFLVLMFPKDHITEALFLMTLLKISCAGLTFAIYLKKYRLRPIMSLFLALSYALCSYSVVQVMNLMWMDAVLALPLLIFSIESLVDEDRSIMFTIVLMYLFITNYYIAYMTGLLAFAYFLYYGLLQRKLTVKKAALFFRQTIIAVLGTAWLLIPTAYSLTLGKTTFSQPDFRLFSKFDFLDFFVKFLPSTYDSVNIQGLPFVYCGIMVLVLVPLYFWNHKITKKEKYLSAAFCIFLLIIMNVSILDLAMHGFQNPNWLNYRYAFFVSFFVLRLSALAIANHQGFSSEKLFLVMLGVAGFVMLVQKQDYSFVQDEATIWVSLGCLLVYGAVIGLMKTSRRYRPFQTLLLLVLCGELAVNALTSLDALDYEVLYSSRESYVPYFREIRLPLSKLKYDDPGLYRVEKTFHRTVNDPMSLGMRGISHSSSTLNAKAIQFLQRMGYSARDHWTKYLGGTPISDSLLGIRYVMTKEVEVPYYDLMFRLESISTYRNPYAMALGFGASSDVLFIDMDEINPFVLQNSLLSSLLGWNYTEFFEEVPVIDIVLENVSHSTIAGHHSYKEIDPSANAQVEFLLEGNGANIYAYFPTNYEREVNLWIDHEWLNTYYGNESYRIMDLGAGEGVRSLIMTITNREVYLKENSAYFYKLNEEKYAEAMTLLAASNWQIDSFTERKMNGTVLQKTDGIFFTSLPYEKGWTIKVDGKKVGYYKVADALIGFDLPAGEHRITMSFVPYGMRLGLILAVIGLGSWIVLLMFESKKGRAVLPPKLHHRHDKYRLTHEEE